MPCYQTPDGMFICGELGPHCADCMDVADYLCDFPVGEGKTCDRNLCEAHATEIAPELHYCVPHRGMWEAFVADGGVRSELRNVIPYRGYEATEKWIRRRTLKRGDSEP